MFSVFRPIPFRLFICPFQQRSLLLRTMVEHRIVEGFDVTKEWIEKTLSKEFNHTPQVVKVDVLTVCGYMSAIARIHLSWNLKHHDFPTTVIAKMPSGTAAEENMEKTGPASEEEDEEQKDPIHEYMHEMEIQVYKMFKKSEHPGLLVPDMFGHRSWNSRPVVLIEDVNNAFHIDLVDGFSEKQLYSIMDQLIALHKWSRKNVNLWKDEVKYVMDNDPKSESYCSSILRMMDQMAHECPKLAEMFDILRRNYCDNTLWMYEMMQKAFKSNNSVFVHGDLWAPQVLWRGGDIASVVDWALCRPGSRTEDILRVLTTCCTVEVRRKMTDPLLGYYVSKMDGECTHAEILEDYRGQLPASCTMMVFAYCMWSNSKVLRHGKDDDEERVRIMRNRLIATIEDTAELLEWK